MRPRGYRHDGAPFAGWFALFAASLGLVLFTSSCSGLRKKEPPVDISMAEAIRFEYAVYLLPAAAISTQDPATLLRESLPKYPGLTVVDQLPESPKSMLLHAYVNEHVRESYVPPAIEYLQHSGQGLSDEQVQRLQKSTRALILDFAHPKADVWTALRLANALAADIARRSGGLVWDEETREVFSPDAWYRKRLASWADEIPDVSTQTVIHIYPNGEYARAITLGMSKMGLPDVVVEETSWSSDNQIGNLINIFSQSLAEAERPPTSRNFKLDQHLIRNARVRQSQIKSLKANAGGVACLSLAEAKWEEGDPKNRLVRLASDGYSGNDSHARQEAMISSFFGWKDSMMKIHHNEQLLMASTKAKSKLPELRKAFNAGLKPGEFIEVKAPFQAENGNREWMWVEVTSWKGDQIKGVLDNEPSEVVRLHAGQAVQVREGEVFDFIHHYPDKHIEGNTTGVLIQKMSEGNVVAAGPTLVPACDAN